MTIESEVKISRLFRKEFSKEYFKQQREASAMDDSISSQARILMNYLMGKFSQLFAKKAGTLAQGMVNNATQISKATLHGSLKKLSGGLSLETGVVPEGMEDVATTSVAENVSLIKSIPSQYFTNVTGAVMRSITTGAGLADLMPELSKYSGETSRRVKNLALDQTRKAYNSINKQRMQALGVKQFEWIHSGGGQQPRESHIKISGHIFDFDTLEEEQAALGVPEADRGIPGHAINCKCTMRPVINFDE
jgi:SPP1 gp7 family putative phage head morphogenesis protein